MKEIGRREGGGKKGGRERKRRGRRDGMGRRKEYTTM